LLQNYLKNQFNTKRPYDMISLAVELSKTCIENACASNFENIMSTVDTLIEFVQGPCTENQITVVESKYLEHLNEILTDKIVRSGGSGTGVSDRRAMSGGGTTETKCTRGSRKPRTLRYPSGTRGNYQRTSGVFFS
jgi:hypothetical protein